jgi:hypothetical protein
MFQNQEAFESGMNEKTVETGVVIRTFQNENIEEAFEENENVKEDFTKHGIEKTGAEIVWMLRI